MSRESEDGKFWMKKSLQINIFKIVNRFSHKQNMILKSYPKLRIMHFSFQNTSSFAVVHWTKFSTMFKISTFFKTILLSTLCPTFWYMVSLPIKPILSRIPPYLSEYLFVSCAAQAVPTSNNILKANILTRKRKRMFSYQIYLQE